MFPIEIYGIIASFCDPKTRHFLCRIFGLPFNGIWVYKKGLDPKTRPNGIVLARDSNISKDAHPDILVDVGFVTDELTSVKYVKYNKINPIRGDMFPNLTTLICTPKNKEYTTFARFNVLKNLKIIYCINCNITISDDLILEECYLENCKIGAVYFPQKIVTKSLYLKDTTLDSKVSIDYQRKVHKEDYLDNFSILSL